MAGPGSSARATPTLSGTTNELGTIFDRLSGSQPEGDDLVTTLDPGAQRGRARRASPAARGPSSRSNPQTGAIKVMASVPSYDPNDIPKPGEFARLNRDPDAPLLNRATQAGYPPGIDVQGRDRDRGDGQRRVHTRLDGERQEPQADLGRPAAELQQRDLR